MDSRGFDKLIDGLVRLPALFGVAVDVAVCVVLAGLAWLIWRCFFG